MAATAKRYLEFFKIPIFNFGRVRSGAMHQQAKFHHDKLNSCGDITYLIFSMVTVTSP